METFIQTILAVPIKKQGLFCARVQQQQRMDESHPLMGCSFCKSSELDSKGFELFDGCRVHKECIKHQNFKQPGRCIFCSGTDDLFKCTYCLLCYCKNQECVQKAIDYKIVNQETVISGIRGKVCNYCIFRDKEFRTRVIALVTNQFLQFPNQKAAALNSCSLTWGSINTLGPTEWLNSEVIDFYLELIKHEWYRKKFVNKELQGYTGFDETILPKELDQLIFDFVYNKESKDDGSVSKKRERELRLDKVIENQLPTQQTDVGPKLVSATRITVDENGNGHDKVEVEHFTVEENPKMGKIRAFVQEHKLAAEEYFKIKPVQSTFAVDQITVADNVRMFGTAFEQFLLRDSPSDWLESKQGCRSLFNRVNFEDDDFLFLPYNMTIKGVHWFLAVVDMKRHAVTFYDSLGDSGRLERAQKFGKQFVTSMMIFCKLQDIPFKLDEWEIYLNESASKQPNGYDCGVFMLHYVYSLLFLQGKFKKARMLVDGTRQNMIIDMMQGVMYEPLE